MRSKKKIIIIFAIELIVLAFICITALNKAEKCNATNITEEMLSRVIKYDDENGWEVKRKPRGWKTEGDLIYGPYIKLDKGTYTIYIDYEADQDQSLVPIANNENEVFIKAGTSILEKGIHESELHFRLTENIDNFEIQVKYNGKGHFQINELSIAPNTDDLKVLFWICFLCFLMIDIIVFNRNRISLYKKEIGAVVFITIIASLPLTFLGINQGHDLDFHLYRIEGIAKGVLNGDFPVRMQTDWLNGYGYPVSVYYGDFLLYFPALLRMMGFTVIASYKAFIIFINGLTTIISYISFNNIFGKKRIGILLSFAYVTSIYRMSDVYIRGAVGEYCAITFLPLVVMAIWKLYTEVSLDFSKCIRIGITLAVGMSGIICSHVLSAEMVSFVLFVNAIALFFRTIKPKIIMTYILAAVSSVLISSAYLIPFCDYYFNENVSINSIVNESSLRIQNDGAYLADFFAFFKSPYGWGRDMQCTPGLVLMGGLVVMIIFWIRHIINNRMKYTVILTVFVMWLSTNLFPWNSFSYHFRLGGMLSQIQIPWRYISVSSVLLCLVLGGLAILFENSPEIEKTLKTYSLNKKLTKNICYYSTIMIGVIMILFYICGYFTFKGSAVVNYYEGTELSSQPFNFWEYLRANKKDGKLSDIKKLKGEIIAKNCDVWNCGRDGNEYSFEINNTTAKDCYVNVPIFNYKYYRVMDSDGNAFDIEDGKNNTIQFLIPENYEGEITIKYVSPWYWRLAEAVSMITVMLICIKEILYWKTHKKTCNESDIPMLKAI